jgi:hypothetical protein
MASTSDEWRSLRRLRAEPPAVASVNDRRRFVFQSSLAQAEELWEAAASVGPATRPLPLFYAMSQVGRAICAAWITQGPWQPKGHGLTNEEARTGDALAMPVSVANDALGMFSMVAAALEEPMFAGQAILRELWASLPDLPMTKELIGKSPRWLSLEAVTDPKLDTRDVWQRVLAPNLGRIAAVKNEDLERVLADYPTTSGFRVIEQPALGLPDGFTISAVLSFPDERGDLRSILDLGDSLPSTTPEKRIAVRPRIGSGTDGPPSQLLTLWALLFGLSQLARYHPDVWVRALNPDRSKVAVGLEEGLEVALARTPELLVSAVANGPIYARMREEVERRRAEARARTLEIAADEERAETPESDS